MLMYDRSIDRLPALTEERIQESFSLINFPCREFKIEHLQPENFVPRYNELSVESNINKHSLCHQNKKLNRKHVRYSVNSLL